MTVERISVVFQRARVPGEAVAEAHPVPGPEELARTITGLRFVLLPLGAVGAGWGAQRAALSLPLALVVLAGALVVLHFGSMVLGFGLTFLGFTRAVRRRIDHSMMRERVEVTPTPEALEVVTGGERHEVPWAQVTVRPFGVGAVVVHVGDGAPFVIQHEHLEVRLSETEWNSFTDLLARHGSQG